MKNKLAIFFLILVALAVGAYFVGTNWYNNNVFAPANNSDEDVEFTVEGGQNFIGILPALKEQGLIKDENAVKIYLRLQNVDPVIKVGTYTIPSTVNVPDLIEILEQGVFKSSVLVTLREGLRYEQIADILAEKFTGDEEISFSKSEFLAICENPDSITFTSDVQDFLNQVKPTGKPLRGFLFPDTYRFDIDADATKIIETLVATFKSRLEENNINYKAGSSLDSFYEELTLASIVEKEASKSDDPALISGILHNRVADNYPLQADSTVNFITGKNDPGVLIADTKIDSPYNTYKYAGLPPTPIDNPGIRTIFAAVKPQTTDYFFFVHDANGKGYYAITYEEHQRNVANYL